MPQYKEHQEQGKCLGYFCIIIGRLIYIYYSAGLMSPAAQHLFRKSQPSPLAQSSGFGDALRSTYGASPLASRAPHSIRKPGSTPTPLFRAGATPLQNSIAKKK